MRLSNHLTKDIFSRLSPWQVTQLAHHPQRPHTVDYISRIFTEFDELSGDRMLSAGFSIVAGVARLEGQPVVVIGHEKGRKTQEKIDVVKSRLIKNFGYCEICATDALNFVASIFAKGDSAKA